MASFPSSIISYTNPQGGSLLTNPDHAGMHTSENNEIVAIETFLGSSGGNNVFSGYQSGWFPLALNGGTPQIAQQQGTYNNAILGTPTVTGGVFNNLTFGTPAITGGTYNSGVFGTPSVTGGTATNLTLITPTFSPSLSLQIFGTVIGTNGTTASTSFVAIPGGTLTVLPLVTSNIQFTVLGEWSNGGLHFNYMALMKNGTQITQITDYQPAVAAEKQFTLYYIDTNVGTAGGTYSLQFKVDNGTATLYGGAGTVDSTKFYAVASPI